MYLSVRTFMRSWVGPFQWQLLPISGDISPQISSALSYSLVQFYTRALMHFEQRPSLASLVLNPLRINMVRP